MAPILTLTPDQPQFKYGDTVSISGTLEITDVNDDSYLSVDIELYEGLYPYGFITVNPNAISLSVGGSDHPSTLVGGQARFDFGSVAVGTYDIVVSYPYQAGPGGDLSYHTIGGPMGTQIQAFFNLQATSHHTSYGYHQTGLGVNVFLAGYPEVPIVAGGLELVTPGTGTVQPGQQLALTGPDYQYRVAGTANFVLSTDCPDLEVTVFASTAAANYDTHFSPSELFNGDKYVLQPEGEAHTISPTLTGYYTDLAGHSPTVGVTVSTNGIAHFKPDPVGLEVIPYRSSWVIIQFTTELLFANIPVDAVPGTYSITLQALDAVTQVVFPESVATFTFTVDPVPDTISATGGFTADSAHVGDPWEYVVEVASPPPSHPGEGPETLYYTLTGLTATLDTSLGEVLSGTVETFNGATWSDITSGLPAVPGSTAGAWSYDDLVSLLAGSDSPFPLGDFSFRFHLHGVVASGTPDPATLTFTVNTTQAAPGVLSDTLDIVVDAPPVVPPQVGPVKFYPPALEWESARAAHVWLNPQRINFVANPSFEEAATTPTISPLVGLTIGGSDTTTETGVELEMGTADPSADVWVLVFHSEGVAYDILPDPWFTFRDNGWLVGVTVTKPTGVLVTSIAIDAPRSGDQPGTIAIGDYSWGLTGVRGVDLTDPMNLIVNTYGTEANLGINAVGYWSNPAGGSISTPLSPQFGVHNDNNLVMQMTYDPSTGTVGGSIGTDPVSLSHPHSEILSLEFEGTSEGYVFGWRSNGSIVPMDWTNPTAPHLTGPRALGPAPRNKTLHVVNDSSTYGDGGYGDGTYGSPLPGVGAGSGSGFSIVESNFFPLVAWSRQWSVEAAIAGTGRVRFGVLCWVNNASTATYAATDWIDIDSTDAFLIKRALLDIPEDCYEGQFRLEFDGPECWLDNVLVDPNPSQRGYFDGAWYTATRSGEQNNDFSWYHQPGTEGDSARENRSFSLFYNGRSTISPWLFGYTDKDGTPYPGVARHWVPEGAVIYPHWDEVYGFRVPSWPGDLFIPVKDITTGSVF